MQKRIMMCMNTVVLLLILFAGMGGHDTANAQSVAETAALELTEPIPADPAVLTGTFENGLRYYVRANKKPEERAELRLVLRAGSVLEDDDQQGLAHLVEHMAFNGTEHFEKQELVEYMESIGMAFGPGVNASTSFDRTIYQLQVPTDKSEFLEKGMLILEDWAHLITFEDAEIDQERGVVLEELRSRRDAGTRVREQQYPFLYKDSRYAERLPIGKADIIESFEHDTLRRYYREWYRPNLMAVIAVGDFDPAQVVALITEHFASIPNPDSAPERPAFPVPDHDELLVSIATDPEITRTSAQLYFQRDIDPDRTVADMRRYLIEQMYNSMLNQRLDELTKQADPPFLLGYSTKWQMVETKAAYVLGANLKDDAIQTGLEALLREAERVRRYGFTESELERTKKSMLRQAEQWYQERDKLDSGVFVSSYIDNFLHNDSMPGVEYAFTLYQHYVPGVQLREVNALTQEWMTPYNRVFLLSAPEKAGLNIPTEDDLRGLLTAAAQQELEPYQENVSDEPLLADLPQSGTVVEERRIEELDVTEWLLSNGVRVVLKPTDFQNDEILFSSFSPGGTSLVPNDEYVSAVLSDSLVQESGLGQFTKIDLEKKLADKVVHVSPGIDELDESVSGSGSPTDVETMLQLLYLTFTAPRLDQTAATAYISRVRENLKNRLSNPMSVFSDEIRITMAQNNFRARPWSVELLDEVEFDDALAIYKDRFADAGDFTFFFVGNFELDALKPLVETYLGGLPATGREEHWQDTGIDPPTGVVEKTVEKGLEPKSFVVLFFTGDYQWSRDTNYQINAMVDALDIRLREVLREDMGGTYGVSVSADLSQYPDQEYSLSISFGCDPKRVDELVDAVFQEIDSLKTTLLDDSYLTRVKQTKLRTYETNLEENSYWLGALQSAYYHHQDPVEVILGYPEFVESTSAEMIRQAAQTYFNLDNYAKFVLYPESSQSAHE